MNLVKIRPLRPQEIIAGAGVIGGGALMFMGSLVLGSLDKIDPAKLQGGGILLAAGGVAMLASIVLSRATR